MGGGGGGRKREGERERERESRERERERRERERRREIERRRERESREGSPGVGECTQEAVDSAHPPMPVAAVSEVVPAAAAACSRVSQTVTVRRVGDGGWSQLETAMALSVMLREREGGGGGGGGGGRCPLLALCIWDGATAL